MEIKKETIEGSTVTLDIAKQSKQIMDNNPAIQKELQHIYGSGETSNFKLAEYLYFAKGVVKKNRNLPGTYKDALEKGDTSNWQIVSLGYGYKIDYAIKCGLRFLLLAQLGDDLVFTHISKVKMGELVTSKRFGIHF